MASGRKLYKFKRYETRQFDRKFEDLDVIDTRFKFDIKTAEIMQRPRLDLRIHPVLTIPLKYNTERKIFEIAESGLPANAYIYGHYYGSSLPSETLAGDYPIAIDEQHRARIHGDDNFQYLYELYKKLAYLSGLLTFSTTTLGADEEYNTGWFLMSYIISDIVRVFVSTDVDGTIYVEQSNNGSNVHYTESKSVTGGTPTIFEVPISMRYLRVRYVNGPTAQSTFAIAIRHIK